MSSERLKIDTAEDRLHRLRLIPWWDADLLQSKTALVLGAGAIGNEVIKNLALVGIGSVRIVDLDTVELSNLSRSVLFRASDEGRPKADVAAYAARDINPDLNATAISADIVHELPIGHYLDADVVISGLDGREARLAANAACIRVNRPYFDGAIQVIDGVARGFNGRNGPCYQCTMSEADWKLIDQRRSCNLLSREQMMQGHVPTTSTIASIIGALLVQQSVLYLHGQDWSPGKAFMFSGTAFDAWTSMYSRRDDCFAHDEADYLERWPDTNSQETITNVLQRAAKVVGEPATLDLRTELITARSCHNCGFADKPMLPRHRLGAGSATCPSCESELALDFETSISSKGPLATLTLAECGVPEFDLIRLRGSNGTADVVLGEWAATPPPSTLQDSTPA